MLGGQKESGSKEYGAPSLAETFPLVFVSFTWFAVLVGDFGLVVVRFSCVVDPAFLEFTACGCDDMLGCSLQTLLLRNERKCALKRSSRVYGTWESLRMIGPTRLQFEKLKSATMLRTPTPRRRGI